MKKISLVITFLISFYGTSFSQNVVYEIEQRTKVEELFTTYEVDSIIVKVNELKHPTDTIYYNFSELTKLIIYPIVKIVGIKEEDSK